MTMINHIRNLLRRSELFAFNQVNRDRWVLLQALTIPAGARVLDVGAGSCVYRPLFSHTRYETQDFAQLRSDQCRAEGYGQIDYVCDATQIPVNDAFFDAVVCTEVLEHLPEPVSAVKEFSRILKPGGKLILTAPLGSGIHQEPYHFYGGYTPYWYKKFLSESGFENIVIEPNAGFFKFFSQESLRFIHLSSPGHIPPPIRWIWTPVWLVLIPLMAGMVPLLALLLDRYDKTKHFTVGYFVTAEKTRNLTPYA